MIEVVLGIYLSLVSLSIGALCVRRWWRGVPLVGWEPRKIVPWTWRDLLLSGGSVIVLLSFVNFALRTICDIPSDVPHLDDLPIGDQMILIVAFSVGSVLAVPLTMVIVHLTCGATWTDWGLTRRSLAADTLRGTMAFGLVFIPMLLIHWCAQQVFATHEEHDFIKLLRAQPDHGYFLIVSFAAVIVAPCVEEYFFRVLLQGWLERVAYRRWQPTTDETGGHVVAAEVDDQPLASPEAPRDGGRPADWRGRWMPIVISSCLFAGAHVDQGAAPVPLFLVALAMGYLYQRTHRMTASLVLHALVNAAAMIDLAITQGT